MTKNKKVLIITSIIIAILLLAVTMLPIFPRFYLGSRIKGNVSVAVDGTDYDLSQLEVTPLGRYKVKAKNGKISIRGGMYGGYGFKFIVPETDCTVKISIMQWNWHQITDFDLDIELSTENGELSCNYVAETSETYNNTFERTTDRIENTVGYTSEGFEIFL